MWKVLGLITISIGALVGGAFYAVSDPAPKKDVSSNAYAAPTPSSPTETSSTSITAPVPTTTTTVRTSAKLKASGSASVSTKAARHDQLCKVSATVGCPGAQATASVVVNPFSMTNLNVVANLKGECWTSSENSSSRLDAYRCASGQQILDPCYTNPATPNSALLCPKSPIEIRTVIKLTVTVPLPTNVITSQILPWAVELPDGQVCLLLNGATGSVGGLRMNYGCPNGTIYGDLNQSNKTWTARYEANGSGELVEVAIKKAYL